MNMDDKTKGEMLRLMVTLGSEIPEWFSMVNNVVLKYYEATDKNKADDFKYCVHNLESVFGNELVKSLLSGDTNAEGK